MQNIHKKFATPISFQQFIHLLFRQILVFYSILYTFLFILFLLKNTVYTKLPLFSTPSYT